MRIPTTKPRYLEEVQDKKYLEEQMVCILNSRKNLRILNNSWIRTLRILIFVIISTVINFIMTRTPRLMTSYLLIQGLQAKMVLNLQELSRISQEKTGSIKIPYKKRSSKIINKEMRSCGNSNKIICIDNSSTILDLKMIMAAILIIIPSSVMECLRNRNWQLKSFLKVCIIKFLMRMMSWNFWVINKKSKVVSLDVIFQVLSL